MIILEKAIGEDIGWSGIVYAPDIFFWGRYIAVAGHPGLYPKKMEEVIGLCKVETPINAAEGNILTFGIHTKKKGVTTTNNWGVRITKEKFNLIVEWIQRYYHKDAKTHDCEGFFTKGVEIEEDRSYEELWEEGKIYRDDKKDYGN
jgi:hypothetical protein